jgi:outer membrane cobalamin receptor
MKNATLFLNLLLLITLSNYSFAQTGTVKGVIIDAQSKEEIIGASVVLQGTIKGTVTDIYGAYKLEKLPVGQQELVISFVGYKKQTIKTEIKSNQDVTLNISLEFESKLLDAVTVISERKTNTENAVVMEIKEAKAVVSGVSKEQIARSQDRNAAEVMQRIPGITIVDNRFVMIRGVSSRYNSVMINNIIAPSTEIDKRTFSFDMISSGSLDRMLINKSSSPDHPGDFAGGVIKLYTVSSVDEDFMSFKLDVGYRNNTTFQPYFQSEGSKTDFLGFDNSFRPLPSNAPNTNTFSNENAISTVRRDFARSLPNNFATNQTTASPDYGFGFNIGKIINIGEKRITTINSINYSNSYQYFARDFYRYFAWVDQETPINKRFKYIDENHQRQQKVNLMSNWSLNLNSKNKIKFSNLFNQIGENETIFRNGEDFIQRPGEDLQNYLLGYRARTIYTGQLEGLHDLGETEKHHINWAIGLSYLGESEPDLRRFRTFKPETSEQFIMQLPPSSNLFETGRYYGNLSEFTFSNGLNYTYDLNQTQSRKKVLKFGYYADYRDRDFKSRYFSYLYPGFFDPAIEQELRVLPLDQIFAPENIRTSNGFVLEEGTRPIDSYNANNLLTAAYAATELSFGKLNLNGGLRAEYNVQNLNTNDGLGIVKVNNPILSILPSLNTGYTLTERTILRASYGRTVNRPEFRELAPFLFYDYKLEAGRVGNPNLKTAVIDNFDLRYEYYPRPGETFSVGGFYKRFTNPIEDRTIITTEQPSFTYINADFAYNYGVEVEIKKSLRDLTTSNFLNKLSINANASYIVSQVDLGITAVAQDRVRPLQGQAPYIVNAALYYNDNKRKFSSSLIYNIYGRNIYSVGDDIFPTIYELERHSLDLTIGKELENGFNFKFGIQNILDFPFRFYQDSDRNGKIDQKDHVVFEFRRGVYFNMSVTYLIGKGKKKSE